jgi:hypothetical protein
MSHVHRYKVSKDSVFGLVHIHAVMECDGVVDKKPCRAKLTKVVTYPELEKTGNERPQYWYRERAVQQTGGR